MIGVLNDILCWISALANLFLWAIITAINAVISAIGLLLAGIVSLLPDMPDAPSWSGIATDVFGYANWVFPVGFLVSTLAGIAILWLSWQAVAVILRIGKVAP